MSTKLDANGEGTVASAFTRTVIGVDPPSGDGTCGIIACGRFEELEVKLCGTIAGGGYEGPGRSPDRADAMVWALTELMPLKETVLPRISVSN